jgi:type I restriction enzyme S subunit
MSFDLPFKLPSGWQIFTVEELVKQEIIAKPLDGNHGGTHPKATDYVEAGVPFVMASDLLDGRVDLDTCKFITYEQASKLRKGFSKAGDVLLSHKATIGRTAIVQENDHDFIMITPQVTYYRVLNEGRLSNTYLKAYFDSRFFQTILALWAGAGSTRAYLGITGQLKLPIILPSVGIQNKISKQVSALNDKIKINSNINQTLEEMAQAIFKSWFADFDPVKAKMLGEQPEGMDAATAALFPDKLVESELGLIPEGWELKPFKKVIDKYIDNRGKTPPLAEDGIPLIEVKHIPANSNFPNFNTEKKFTEQTYSTWFRAHVEPKDILISTVGTIGRTSFVKDTRFGIAQNVLGLRFGEVTTPEYMFFTIKAHRFQHDMEARLVTTVQSSIKRKDLDTIDILIPPLAIQGIFSELVSSFLDTQFSKMQENLALEKLRDTLLPKLLSGGISLIDELN